MNIRFFQKYVALALLSIVTNSVVLKAADMEERIHTAIEILQNKQQSGEPIPSEVRKHAKGIAIFTITKAGIGIGGQGGEGIIVLRLEHFLSHSWTAPYAFNLGGGSIGAQLGVSTVRYIVVLNTDDAVRRFTHPQKMDWDATATGTAGSSTGTEKVTSEELSKRAMIVYKDTDGIFGGATLGGTTIIRKDSINMDAYGDNVRRQDILNGTVPAPASAHRLFELLDQ